MRAVLWTSTRLVQCFATIARCRRITFAHKSYYLLCPIDKVAVFSNALLCRGLFASITRPLIGNRYIPCMPCVYLTASLLQNNSFLYYGSHEHHLNNDQCKSVATPHFIHLTEHEMWCISFTHCFIASPIAWNGISTLRSFRFRSKGIKNGSNPI